MTGDPEQTSNPSVGAWLLLQGEYLWVCTKDADDDYHLNLFRTRKEGVLEMADNVALECHCLIEEKDMLNDSFWDVSELESLIDMPMLVEVDIDTVTGEVTAEDGTEYTELLFRQLVDRGDLEAGERDTWLPRIRERHRTLFHD